MRRVIVVAVALIAVVVLTVGYIGLTYFGNQTGIGSPQYVRDQAMEAIAATHPETQDLMADLAWIGGKQETGVSDQETYLYTTSSGWRIQLNGTVTANPTYDLLANYTQGEVTLEWMGIYQDGNITEYGIIEYGIEPTLTPQEEALYSVSDYIEDNHVETEPFFEVTSWSGGEVPNPEGFVGSQTYKYIGIGWNITMQHPVVPNPIYSVNATYADPHDATGRVIVEWQGNWQDGVVTETKYVYTP